MVGLSVSNTQGMIMTKEEAKLGTVVYIAGGPTMTIAEINHDRCPNPVKVVWFNKSGSLEQMWTHHDVLTTERPLESAYYAVPTMRGL